MDTTILKQKISSAPEDIKEMIGSFEIVDLLEKITEENKLVQGQSKKLGQEIVCVLVGITKVASFPSRLIALGFPQNIVAKIINAIDTQLFSKVRISLQKTQSASPEIEKPEIHPDKETILKDIENPTPVKPIVSNPAGKNLVLDAQHNLPEQEKKILISSAAVPSRGPILGNIKPPIAPQPRPFIPPVQPKPATPTAPTIPVTPPRPITPPVIPQQPSRPSQPVPQAPKPPQVPTPLAPSKYTVDPYREPAE